MQDRSPASAGEKTKCCSLERRQRSPPTPACVMVTRTTITALGDVAIIFVVIDLIVLVAPFTVVVGVSGRGTTPCRSFWPPVRAALPALELIAGGAAHLW